MATVSAPLTVSLRRLGAAAPALTTNFRIEWLGQKAPGVTSSTKNRLLANGYNPGMNSWAVTTKSACGGLAPTVPLSPAISHSLRLEPLAWCAC
jgi:hypothetical protein